MSASEALIQRGRASAWFRAVLRNLVIILVGIPTSFGFAWTEIISRRQLLPFWPWRPLTVACLFLAFAMLGLPQVPPDERNQRWGRIPSMAFTAFLAAWSLFLAARAGWVVAGSSALYVLAAAAVGFGLALRLPLPRSSLPPSRRRTLLEMTRLGLLVVALLPATVLYVRAAEVLVVLH